MYEGFSNNIIMARQLILYNTILLLFTTRTHRIRMGNRTISSTGTTAIAVQYIREQLHTIRALASVWSKAPRYPVCYTQDYRVVCIRTIFFPSTLFQRHLRRKKISPHNDLPSHTDIYGRVKLLMERARFVQ